MITPENIVRHELIGLRVKVVGCTSSRRGPEGRVVDETRNMLVIETPGGERTVPKDGHVFSFSLPSGSVAVEGRLLVARPEDRIKKKQKRW